MRCENKTFLQNDPGFLQEISSTAVEVGLVFSNLPVSQSAITRFLNRFGGPENLRRAFESLPLRHG